MAARCSSRPQTACASIPATATTAAAAAGGAIFLQAPVVENRGVLAANGGGGGSGSSFSIQFAGKDALPGDQPAPGGERVNDSGHPGGCGFALADTGCTHEGTGGDGNGGGGGGVGRVVVLTAVNGYIEDDGLASPEASLHTD